ncbi:MAG: tRNA pseudouridine(38-40) synthase TruA [Bacteroidota bacterium]|nr:tRNA pseudouridine(38-40) synthase TruA [Bacteroidota bacterium]
MSRYALLLEYDGSEFNGWQRQSGGPTIQASVEKALQTFTRQKYVQITGSGRTDAGVHARGQVAHFECETLPDDAFQRLVKALNGLLPPTVAVRAATQVHENFHARYDARLRRYHYYASTEPLALERNRRLVIYSSPDFERMNRACALLIGNQHFGAFCRTRSATVNRICSVRRAQWEPEVHPGCWRFVVEADRFLHGMVRALVGTLLEIGRGKRSVQDMKRILATQDRRESGVAAPAYGLVLEHVKYDTPIFGGGN